MKSSTAFAISALATLAVAIPLQKRDLYTTTVVAEVTQTVDMVTTVWVQPGDPRLLQQQAANAAKNQPAAAPAPVITSSSSPAAPAYTPPPATSSPAPQPAPVIPQPQQKEVVKQPAAVQASSPAPAPAPSPSPSPSPSLTPSAAPPTVATAAAPPAQSSPSSPASSGSTSGSGPSGGACGEVNGKCSGEVTTFDGSGAAGSCGWVDPQGPGGEDYFALAWEMMGPLSSIGDQPANPYCGRKATIVYNGKEYPATLTDKCPGCVRSTLSVMILG